MPSPQLHRIALLALTLLISACSDPEPIRLGFIGGLSGTNADLGLAARNGAQLAVEQHNTAAQKGDRPAQLIVRDDELNPEQGKKALTELLEQQVHAVIGPMTSAVAMAIAPLANEAGVLLMGGPVSTDMLNGRDDQFFRTIGSNDEHARVMATYLRRQHNIERVSLVVDHRNKAYTDSWAGHFSARFEALGARIVQTTAIESSTALDYAQVASQALSQKPQAVLLITSALDAALLINQLRQQQEQLIIAAAEWAGSGKLIEMGGNAAENVIVAQYINTQDNSPTFTAFRDAFAERFGEAPGFPAMTAYNATGVVLQGLAEQRSDETLKQTLLRLRRFAGVQGAIEFDAYGDTITPTFITYIRNGQYQHAD
ncbi:ABC transporter substrate-binding protein [Pseudomonas sp.]|uniref:ABC transporter substrate-binding protein n=1 Tax=Pseudomonas sp. TaxID=306 RepID=UPI0027315896|nr:ABC transporter substrate-binding protein [Pseudomonas sp.]MDP2244371.1 ABC transporter substrate-binding protein [Pseudomonas sp.]